MGKKQTTPIVVNDVEYTFEDMTDQQQAMVNHCNDLDRKIKSTQFNLDQLSVGKDAFVKMLVEDLESESEEG
tara:strand:+ start:258 stop:473 length:216 start_codon:yes stop_codon:yes gene_type:complete